MPFTKDGYPAEKLIPLKGDPAQANVIRELGIDVVTCANNHGMDFGFEGLRMTSQALDTVGVAHVGSGENVFEAFAPVVKTLNGVKVAYIGVTTTLPNGAGAGRSRPGLAGVRFFSKFVVDTVTIDESPGMAPQMLYWWRSTGGVPYGWVQNSQDEIATYQRPLAYAMIDAGASAIFGHHPHVVQGVGFYKGSPIFYSLGNFIFSNSIVTPSDGWRKYPPYSWSSLQQTLSDIGALAKVSWAGGKLASCSVVPVTLAEDGEPLEATSEDAEVLLSRLGTLSKACGMEFGPRKQARGYEILISENLEC
ncbi:uncharacterized protein A1O5_00150 [Cladophialophora psammophila CBS 110553]|uniref:Capsule synthesis protein CapA domain-containing protein n=1 Tax=Cladophialophora psammophila CBS 110553 TaxID=1182543 RepID=W9X5X4_9EURO|nr:uncharacterized protein A1O5_00150 [Cladophialophora psammophila CBS 110553]EXJ75643.1 hypothetical protein A1O5_00150 [Cladophialophora psammophila CBS 110553]